MRKKEVEVLAKQKYLDALCVFFWAITPSLIKCLTFATATLIDQPMTAATAFASVALLNMLIGPLNAFPWVLNGLVEAYVSLKRVQSYLDVSAFQYCSYIPVRNVHYFTILPFKLPDIDLHKYYSVLEPQTPSEDDSNPRPIVISMKNVSFRYNIYNVQNDHGESAQNFFLRSISGEIKKVSGITSVLIALCVLDKDQIHF